MLKFIQAKHSCDVGSITVIATLHPLSDLILVISKQLSLVVDVIESELDRVCSHLGFQLSALLKDLPELLKGVAV